jgi:DNA topoisomerase 6 subunit A-like protein
MDAKTIKDMLEGATSKWAKQRKSEEKYRSAAGRRYQVMTSTRGPNIKEAAEQIMEEAYMKASGGGKLPAPARMIFYAARPLIQAITGEPLKGSKYFTQTLLPDYMEEHNCADWRVIWDARGHLIEPHTEKSVPLGTIEVQTYLRDMCKPIWLDPKPSMPKIETCGPSGCYGAILFIEKEGFSEIFEAVQLAERFDIAIMSTKGTSVTAARKLVDELCDKDDGIPLFVLHDFDKTGLTILKTLREDTRRYTFWNKVNVIDLGLRLEDVEERGLEGEEVDYGKINPYVVRENLKQSGASPEEVEFLVDQRVELNAFTADGLVEWLEEKLEEHGVEKVVPELDMLQEAYRREKQSAYLKDKFEALLKESKEYADGVELPEDLDEKVVDVLKDSPELSWNQAVAEIAR